MEETSQQQKGGMSKKTIAIIVGLLLIIGGSVAAYVLLDKSPKEQYFTAEKDTLDFILENVEEKYKLESAWAEKTNENASRAEHRIQLALDGGIGGSEFGAVDPFDIMSNFYFAFDFEGDPNENKMSLALGAELGNFDIGNIILSLAEHDLFIELPFTNDIIHLADSDINRLLHEEDPMMFPEEGFIDFTDLFDYSSVLISEEDIDYVTAEYVEYIYELLPDSAFTEEKDKVTVLGNDINANKITFALSEEEVKDILAKVFTKIEDDKKLKEILRDYLETQMVASQAMIYSPYQTVDDLIDEMMEEFDEAIQSSKDEIDSLYIPDGFSSIIWVDGKHIVQRDFSFTFGLDDIDYVALDIQGAHKLTKENQEHEMQFSLDDGYEKLTLELEGEFNWDGKQGDDTIVLRIDEGEIIIETSEEQTSKNKKEFTRSLIIKDDFSEDVGLEWSGEASYSNDQMKSSHQFTLIDDNDPESMSIYVDKKGSIIKEVSIPEKSDAVLLGEMELFEIDMYIDQLAAEFEQWVSELMGGGAIFGF